ncbi:hypothetical protein GQ53DRAFT_821679 [Thozetella sp. PMI_491]|nr:hypothetical protein GQ53DRAFT_821679 [Thozetella sp. PMI_491]
MVSATYHMQPFFRTQAPLSVDTQRKYFDDDEILDENILDQNGIDSALELSPAMADSRRESFAVGPSLFSPKTEDWHQAVEMQSVSSNNPFLEPHSTNPFAHAQSAFQGQWPMTTSGSATPLQAFDGLPQEFDTGVSVFHQRPAPVQSQTPFSNPTNQVTLFQHLGHQSIPTSPDKEHWTAEMKSQAAMAKRNRPASPLFRGHNELRRGDGIRKKNARFDIPAERNLSNIDHLISQSTDEQEIKELKQQKRLLRNRQAALDSRQRKKMHTERLEDEKKQFTECIANMEDSMKQLDDDLRTQKTYYENYIHTLKQEHEDLIAKYTMETGELRKKINVLTGHIQTLEGASMQPAGVPGNAGYPGGYGEMEGLTMEGSWNGMPVFDDYQMVQPTEVKQEMSLMPAKKPEPAADAEKPGNSLLWMLLMIGALVASSGKAAPRIPPVTEDVRVASAHILDNVYKEAGVSQVLSRAVAPQPSGATWAQPTASAMPGVTPSVDGVGPSMLSEMADALTQPTEQQANEQLFSLSTSQYNGVTSQEFAQMPPPERSTSQGRRNLAEAMASMRNNHKQSAAEVYTRSLLWDQIPGDVVRDFAKMVADFSSGQSGDTAISNEGET